MNKKLKARLLSLAMAAALSLTLLPMAAFATEDNATPGIADVQDSGAVEDILECHPQHDAACGYQEAVEGADCTFSGMGEHTHDAACGYVEAVAGMPCTHECEICRAAALPAVALLSQGDYSFDAATGKLTVTTNEGTTAWRTDSSIDKGNIKSVEIIPGVTLIGYSAFYQCTVLESITIPDSVTEIGEDAFRSCGALKNIDLPDGITVISKNLFNLCTSLNNITIPDSVTTIGGGAFVYCSALTSITIPDSVTTIGEGAFSSCSSLSSITIPNSVTVIDGSAFLNCTSLNNITIPDSVTTIGGGAFLLCTSLTSITIPASVTEIGSAAFSLCSQLASVTFQSETPPASFGDNVFSDVSTDFKIYVPKKSIAAYKEKMSAYQDKIVGVEDYPAKTQNFNVKSETANPSAKVLLPEIAGATYGAVTVKNDGFGLVNSTPSVSGRTLMLSIASKPADTTALFEIPVTGATSYNDFTMTVQITTTDAELFTITFDANGGSVSSTSDTTNADGKLSSLPTPTYAGHTFNGWYTAASGGTSVGVDNVYTADTTIYAQWTAQDAGGGSSTSGGGSSSSGGSTVTPPTGKTRAGGISTPGKTQIDSPIGIQGSAKAMAEAVKNAVAAGNTSATVYANFANFTALKKDGLKAINDAAAAAVQGKNVALTTEAQFDKTAGNTVVSRISLDPAKLAAVMPDKLPLGVYFDQKKDATVQSVNKLFAEYFDNKIVSVVYEQKSSLAVNAEFCAKLNLADTFGQDKQLYFYTYDNAKNIYNRIAAPGYFVDKNGFAHINAPLGGSIIISDKPLIKK